MYVCMCVCTYVHIHVYMCAYMHAFMYISCFSRPTCARCCCTVEVFQNVRKIGRSCLIYCFLSEFVASIAFMRPRPNKLLQLNTRACGKHNLHLQHLLSKHINKRTGVVVDPPKKVTLCQEAMKTHVAEKRVSLTKARLTSSVARCKISLSVDSL